MTILCDSALSVSLKYWRRSEWPSTTPWTSISVSIGAETSPVNAPFSASCMFCAKTSTREPRVGVDHRLQRRERHADRDVDAVGRGTRAAAGAWM